MNKIKVKCLASDELLSVAIAELRYESIERDRFGFYAY